MAAPSGGRGVDERTPATRSKVMLGEGWGPPERQPDTQPLDTYQLSTDGGAAKGTDLKKVVT